MADEWAETGGRLVKVLVMDDEEWNSTFELETRQAKPRLDGVLQLEFSPEFDPRRLQGKAINVFDWVEGAQPSKAFASIQHPSRIQLDLTRIYSDGEILVTSVLDKPERPGDFNGDAILDSADINSLSSRIYVASTDKYFDLDNDDQITDSDLTVLVEELIGTHYGDADLDGRVQFDDFLVLSEHYGQPGSWNDGDFDTDGLVDFIDHSPRDQFAANTPLAIAHSGSSNPFNLVGRLRATGHGLANFGQHVGHRFMYAGHDGIGRYRGRKATLHVRVGLDQAATDGVDDSGRDLRGPGRV